nr:hypothetical protein CFP56_02920 [Quercus suber]
MVNKPLTEMLCDICCKIQLKLEMSVDDEELLRQYDSLWHVKTAALTCDLCRIVFDSLCNFEAPDAAPYCMSMWGEELWQYLLNQTKIYLYHVVPALCDHNIVVRGLLDAEAAPKYVKGPRACQIEQHLGGIYVPQGESYCK